MVCMSIMRKELQEGMSDQRSGASLLHVSCVAMW